MPHWMIKSALQRGISWLPRSQFWNGQFQRWVTRSTELPESAFCVKLEEGQRYLGAVREAVGAGEPFRALEVGTGWYPTIPVAMYLCGAEQVFTIDIDPLLSGGRLATMIEHFQRLGEAGRLDQFLPGFDPDRLRKVVGLLPVVRSARPEKLLETIGIRCLLGDARSTGLPDGSIDLFFSSGVLEYIPRPVLEGILRESARLASRRFASIHRLNLVDQFSYFDKSITPFNFLKFTPRQWKWANSPLIWQNRLRISDYRELFTGAGMEVVGEDNTLGRAEDLARVKLAREFQGYREDDLLVLHSYIRARMAGGSVGGQPIA